MAGVKRLSSEEQSANLAKRLKKIEQEFKDLGGQEILKRLKREGKYDKLDRMQIAEIVSRENPEAGRKLKSYYRITEEKKELDEAIKTGKAKELAKRKEDATKKQAHEDSGKATVLKGKAKELDDLLKLLRGMRANYQEGTAMRTSIEKQIALKERQLQALTAPAKKKKKTKTNTNTSSNVQQPEQKIEIRKIEPVKIEPLKFATEPLKVEPKKVELKFKPTVRLIPKIKHNGKPSKRNFEAIELMDAKGQVFRLTKDMFKEIEKNWKNMDAEFSWDKYVELAKNGSLKPETVASFFKKGPNAPDLGVNVAAIALQQSKQNG